MTEGYLAEAFEHAGVPLPADPATVAVAARHFIRRLLDHPQPSLDGYRKAFPGPTTKHPERSSVALMPVAVPSSSDASASPVDAINTDLRAAIFGEATKARTISEVFAAWVDTQPLERRKLVDEWRKAINRFIALWGAVAAPGPASMLA